MNSKLSVFFAAVLLTLATSSSFISAAVQWPNSFDSFVLRYDQASNVYKPFAANDTSAASFGVALASLNINRSYNVTGWDLVEVATDAGFVAANSTDPSAAYYGAGYLEAFYTFDTISDSWLNWGVPVQRQVEAEAYNVQWVRDHIAYLQSDAFRAGNASASAFSRQVAKFMAWIEGTAAGYAAGRAKFIADGVPGADQTVALNYTQFFLIQFQDEVGDVNQSNPKFASVNPYCPHVPAEMREHCSALVKLTSDDVIITHTTWSHFRTMLRQYKTYTFESVSVTLSGYPASLASSDDWYITSNRLVVTETTNNQFNMSLSNQYVVPKTVSEFMRVVVANALATDAKQWVELFLTENSGTYPNQYIILNAGQITAGDIARGTLPADSLWICENIPGPYSGKADMTWFLNQHKYWPSFNRPYFPEVAAISCNTYYAETYGPLWGYDGYCRQEIFKRDHSKVTDIESMKRMIRYNDWQHDPFSVVPWCSGCNPTNGPSLSIAARYDLISPTFAAGSNASAAIRNYLVPMYDGAIDGKITSWKSFQATQASKASSTGRAFAVKSYIIDGPTNDQQPTFVWSKGTLPPNSHLGHPDVFNFSWVEVVTTLQAPVAAGPGKATWTVVIVVACIVGVIVFVVVVYKTFFATAKPPSYDEIQAAENAGRSTNAESGSRNNQAFTPKERQEKNSEPLIR
jgi:hypothetical protein